MTAGGPADLPPPRPRVFWPYLPRRGYPPVPALLFLGIAVVLVAAFLLVVWALEGFPGQFHPSP